MLVKDRNGNNALEIAFVTDFGHSWSDSGSGAEMDVSFWWPKVSGGFRALGHYANKGYDAPESPMIAVKAIQPDALKEPVGWELVWDDAGSGADDDGSIWIPVAPRGYSALGMFVQPGHSTAERMLEVYSKKWPVACVRSDLVTGANVSDLIWNDAGSGADHDVSVWQIGPLSPPAGSPMTYLTSGSFCAYASHNKPLTTPVVNALAVEFPLEMNGSLPLLPTLSSLNVPDETFMVRDSKGYPIPYSVSYLSCVQVNDDRYRGRLKAQIEETPFYKLEKYALYRRASFHTNSDSEPGNFTFRYNYGISETDSTSISLTTGLSVTVGVSAEGNVGAAKTTVSTSTTVSYSLGVTRDTSSTISAETSHEVSYRIPAGGAGCLFTLSYRYILRRADGTEVNSWTMNSDHTHYATFPK